MIEFPHLMQVLMALTSLSAVIVTIVLNRGKAAADKVAQLEADIKDKASIGRMGALEDRVDRVEDRTTTMEGEIRHLPSRDQAQSLELALREMRGELGVLAEKLKPIANTTERLQEFLIDEARQKRGLS